MLVSLISGLRIRYATEIMVVTIVVTTENSLFQLNSLVPAFLDIQYFICFYTKNSYWTDGVDADIDSCVDKSYFIRPLVAMLPAWFRFAQCLRRYRDTKEAFPHLANAVKYSTSFFVVIFSSLTLASQSKSKKKIFIVTEIRNVQFCHPIRFI